MEKSPKETPEKPQSTKDIAELLKNFALTRKAIVAGKVNFVKRPKQAAAIVTPFTVIRCGWGCAFGKEFTPVEKRMA